MQKIFILVLFITLTSSESLAHPRYDDGDRSLQTSSGGDPSDNLPLPGRDEIRFGVYQPWTGVLQNLKTELDPERNYVIWINIPAGHPMDLRTLDKFRSWVLGTPIKEMSISHNMVAWRCRGNNGQMYEAATGMTGEVTHQTPQLILGNFGLTTFLSVFTDGHLNPSWEVSGYIEANVEKRGVVFAGFEVSESECRNMNDFVLEFINHPSEPFRRFGLLPKPALMEGGGCVTFAAELLNRAGLLQSVIPSFNRNLRARRELMGGNLPKTPPNVELPAMPWLQGQKYSIPVLTLALSSWEKKGGKAIEVEVMDPELMLYSFKQFANAYLDQLPPEQREEEKAALDKTPLGPRVTVGKLLFKKKTRTLIDDTFSGMSEVRDLTRNWIREKQSAGYQLRRVWTSVNMPAFLMER